MAQRMLEIFEVLNFDRSFSYSVQVAHRLYKLAVSVENQMLQNLQVSVGFLCNLIV